jgi:nitrogen fixation NifU-like protein
VAVLYSDVILERFRHPRYRGELAGADGTHEDVNPLCGDRIRIELRLDGGRTPEIEAVRYRGDACAIALASADLLAELVEGRPVREAELVDRETLLHALQATIRPSRLRCVTLPLDVFRTALAEARRAAQNSAPPPDGAMR